MKTDKDLIKELVKFKKEIKAYMGNKEIITHTQLYNQLRKRFGLLDEKEALIMIDVLGFEKEFGGQAYRLD